MTTEMNSTQHLGVYLTTREVSDLTRIPPATLRYWRHRGTGPASFVLSKQVLYRKEEVERWIADQQAATTRGGAA